jgi:hypothetical protein
MDSYNTYVKIYPFEKFESIESETYWKYCKYSLIVFKPFEDNERHLIDNNEPTPENWIKYWTEFRDRHRDTIYYDLFLHIKEEIDNEIY